jgi:hypothetical protein
MLNIISALQNKDLTITMSTDVENTGIISFKEIYLDFYLTPSHFTLVEFFYDHSVDFYNEVEILSLDTAMDIDLLSEQVKNIFLIRDYEKTAFNIYMSDLRNY